MSTVLLDRLIPQPSLSLLQSQVDGLVGSFTEQATDWRSLAAMMAGGMTYRLGRVGALAAGTGRIASLGIGLGAEVTAFEMSHRSLSSLTGESHANPNLWRWEGQGGIRQGLLNSLVTFGALKGAGRLAQGENIFVQHLLQDTGMVLGHQVSASFGITDRPQGTLAEQFLHAEATNLQLGAGMALAHSVAPGIQGLERGLDLSLPLAELPSERTPLQIGREPAFATARGEIKGEPPGFDLTRVAMMEKDDPPSEGKTEEKSSNSSPRKNVTPVVERFSRDTEQVRLDATATIKSVYERIGKALSEANPRSMALVLDGKIYDKTRRTHLGERVQEFLKIRHGRRLISDKFALALLFSEQDGIVLFPHGVEIRMEEASPEILRRLRRIEKDVDPSPPVKEDPKDTFQYLDKRFRIEGFSLGFEFKSLSPSSQNPLQEIQEIVGEHLKISQQSLVLSCGLANVNPIDLRVELSRLLREKGLGAGREIAIALMNDGVAFVFRRQVHKIQVHRTLIQAIQSEAQPAETAPEAPDTETASMEGLPKAESTQEIFKVLEKMIRQEGKLEILYSGGVWKMDTTAPLFAKWLEMSIHRLPQGKTAVVYMPNVADKKTETQGQTLIFFWNGDKVDWRMEPLGTERLIH